MAVGVVDLLESSAAARAARETNLERRLSFELLRVVQAAAVAAAHTTGHGDVHASDHAAVEAMRRAFDQLDVTGRIVIGEGERDEAPMLHIGEIVGRSARAGATPLIDIAVDPLEGTNLCAFGAPNAIAVLAAAEAGGLLHAPDCYMEKIVAGPACRGAVSLDAPVAENVRAIASRLDRRVRDVVVMVLDRPRHQQLISEIRRTGARVRLISDGDLSAGIATALPGGGVQAVMGSGGAPEGVITAAAIRCLGGEMQGRLIVDTPELRARIEAMGIGDPDRLYSAEDLAPGRQIVFAACGVTSGLLLKGVRFSRGNCRTHTLAMTLPSREVRWVETMFRG